ncbi:MAG: M20/M25/M40 family metallo-hydrolase [Bacteroidetes bacterium]|nr:M20/M25/M40 family metallo-hydrolase [Bacteroidota bacterium]
MKKTTILVFLLAVSLVHAQTADTTTAYRIKIESVENSEVMNILDALTNGIGPRLTNSKKMADANQWAKSKLESYGLKAEVEPWGDFGNGWDVKSFSAQVTSPYAFPLMAYPKAWSPGLKGMLKGRVVLVEGTDLASIMKTYDGKLKNAIVLLGEQVNVEENFEPLAKRFSDSELLEMANEGLSADGESNWRARYRNSPRFAAYRQRLKIFSWINSQSPALIIDGGGGSTRGLNSGIVNVQGAMTPLVDTSDVFSRSNPKPWDPNVPKITPQIMVSTEQYNQMVSLVKQGKEVIVECDLQVSWQNKDTKGYNTIGEWAGSDLRDQIVMVGAHMDSWHAATGATDNAQGVAVMTEAVRILKRLGLQPRRTVRVGFWSGEEQGLFGSGGYVQNHLKDSNGTKQDFEKFSVYFNLDNGAGQIRGIYLQNNEKAESYFRSWLEPFRGWNASTLTLKSTGGSDHQSFDRAGLPGFQFIQDPIAYGTKTWHTNMDHYDHVIPEDMKRNAAIMAYFIYMASTVEEMVPRK